MSTTGGLLTCITCRVGFHDPDIQREHYKSDWHRYNLKRKVIQLPPVTAENFQEKVEAQEALEAKANAVKNVDAYCSICKKAFGNEKAYQNHLTSNKHYLAVKESTAAAAAVAADTAVSSGENEQSIVEEMNKINLDKSKDVLISNIPSNAEDKNTVTPNESNASKSDSKTKGGKHFPPATPADSIPLRKTPAKMEVDSDDDDEDEEWDDIEGTPIPINTCLFCEKESRDMDKNLEHMSIAHSFFIPDAEYCVDVEGLMTYLGEKVGEGMVCLWCNDRSRQFYTVLAAQQHMRDKGHCRILHEGEAVFEFADFYDYSSSYPNDAGDVNPDEVYQPEPCFFNENMQLVLPSGVTLGHRALKIYYKQYVRPGSQIVQSRQTKRNKLLQQYRAIGYGDISLQAAQMKHRDQKYFKFVRDKYRMKLGVTGNKTMQTYFRRQVQF